jgi:hypothetical protein
LDSKILWREGGDEGDNMKSDELGKERERCVGNADCMLI